MINLINIIVSVTHFNTGTIIIDVIYCINIFFDILRSEFRLRIPSLYYVNVQNLVNGNTCSLFPVIYIPPKTDVLIEINNSKEEYLSKKIPDLFPINYERLFYSLNEKYGRTYKYRDSIPKYQVKLYMVCHPHRNYFNIYKDLFGMPFLNTYKDTFAKFCIISSPGIRVLRGEWEDIIIVEHVNLFNKYLISILKVTRELNMVSKLSYPKGVVIMLIVDNCIPPNEKIIKTTEAELNFDVTKEYIYNNLMLLLLSW